MPGLKDILSILPQLIVAGTGILVLLLGAFFPKLSRRLLANLSVLGLLGAGFFGWKALTAKAAAAPTMQGMVLADGYTGFFTLVFVVGAAISIFLSPGYLDREGGHDGEYYALLLFTTVGALVMASTVNLICIFIGLEILSIALYILAGYHTERARSDEAAVKYFLLGAFASAFFLYGIALVYGATGHLGLTEIAAEGGAGDPGRNFLLLAGVALLLVGFGFKVAVVPFHVWTPDVYEGAPTSVTAFMSVIAKAAGFAAFLRVLAMAVKDPGLQIQVSAVLASIAALTMLVGNVVAVVQRSIKRMLAYSSIAHAGYMLVGLVAVVRPAGIGLDNPARGEAISAVLFYTLAYTVSNLGAFGVVLALQKKGAEIEQISDLEGVGYRYPLLGILLSLFLLSLAGLPPTAGFFGKLFLVNALVGMSTPLVWLIVLFLLTSVVSFFYYLGPVRAMYFARTDDAAGADAALTAGWHLRLALACSAIGTVVLGLWAGGALSIAQRVAVAFMDGAPMNAMMR